jgi:serine/threonine protein kinase
MSLTAGDRLGPYEILALIGAGGMGEVYRARDRRLDRIVAVKVSKEDFSERFEREAQAVAALNHPHICTLYDVGPNYLVMEYIEGTPVKGPLPLDLALKYSAQICDALDAAHSKGITHRDLKPANILVTKAGVKLLDFGLAKRKPIAKDDDETLTMGLTASGQIIGTLYYMSPEQVQGKDAGPESDIFSFGLVLYELLTGKRAFEGQTSASVIAAILERPAPSVAEVAPAALDRVLKRCLEKDPERRWQSARDLKAVLEEIASDQVGRASARAGLELRSAVPWTLAVLLALSLGFIAHQRLTEDAPRVFKMFVQPPEKAVTTPLGLSDVSVSPDGKSIAFTATVDGKNQIWVRALDSLAARPLAGTEEGETPFWSPDSRWLGFFAGGKLKKIEVSGGPALTVCDSSTLVSGSWGKDYIVFGSPTGILRVSPSGCNPEPVTVVVPKQERSHLSPWFLPDGRHFFYAVFGMDPAQNAVYVGDVESKDPAKNRHRVLTGVFSNAYAQGYLLFLREHTLMAQRFDTGSLELRGDAAPAAEQVDSILGFGSWGVSQNGVLVYTSGTSVNTQLTWYDHLGKASDAGGTPGIGLTASLSPDASTIAYERMDKSSINSDIWLLDARGSESRFTFGGGFNAYPVWSPDGSEIAYYGLRGGTGSVYIKPRSGSGEEKAVPQVPGFDFPLDWSRDRQFIVMGVSDPKTKMDIWIAPMSGDQKPFVYLNTKFNETSAKLSPNGRWLAYVSDETNRNEVYLQTFPKPGGEIHVSNAGGIRPLWSRDGKELYYVSPDQKLMSVELKATGDSVQPGAAKVLFPVRMPGSAGGFVYDVSKDGRFIIPTPAQSAAAVPFTVIVNWTADLKK